MEAMNEMVAVRRTPTARWRPRRASGVRESPAAGSTYARELTLNCGKRSRRRRVELMDRDDVAYEGQREYTPAFLRIYDLLILGFFAPVVWRCPTTRLVEGYRRHVGHRHLDVVLVLATSWHEPECLTAALSLSSIQRARPRLRIAAVAAPGHHDH
jgi:hypothetical protein